jgi:hypothetical protein
MKSKTINTICYCGLFLAIIFVLSGYKKSFLEGFSNPVDYPTPSKGIEQTCKSPSTPGNCKTRVGYWCSL